MTAHPDVDTLSTYLDSELSRRQHFEVERHLDLCERCRQRLSGLEKVVAKLEALERLAPPSHLGSQLQRLASLQADEPGLIRRLEKGAARISLQSNLAPVFAIVVALILIIYMLSWGLHRQAAGRIPVHLGSPESPASLVEDPPLDSSRQIAGRTFELIDGVWVEQGLLGLTVAEQVGSSDPRVQSWFASYPALEEVADLGGRVRLSIEQTVVEIRFDEP